MLNYCAFIAVLTMILLLLVNPSMTMIKTVVTTIVIFAFTALASFLSRRSAFCPLCKGMPLAHTKARVHTKALRIYPLSHSTSAMLSLLFTQTFRCIYCGSRFDLLKKRSLPRSASEGSTQDSLS